MKYFLKAFLCLCLVASACVLQAQLTTITAAKILMGGVPIPSGTVTFTPVSTMGQPIAFAQGGGGLNSPTAFPCTITAGAITGSCQIPDAQLTTPANILYAIQVTNIANSRSFTLQAVPNITGATWALDSYGPPAQTSNVQAVQAAVGDAVPSACIMPSTFTKKSAPTGYYICINGVFVLQGSVNTAATAAFTAAQKFQVGPRFGATSHIATGDSITFGTGVAITANDYVNVIARKTGITPTNLGVGGYQSEDWVLSEIFPQLNPTRSNNPIVTALILHNDAHYAGTSSEGGSFPNGNNPGGLANANSAMLAGLTWATIPITSKVLATQHISSTGTWNPDTSIIADGGVSNVQGSTITYNLTTTTPNQAMYFWYGGQDGDAGTGTISINGAVVGSFATAPTSGQCICTINGVNNRTVWAQRYVIPAAGVNAITVKVTSASGNVRLVGFGTPDKTLPATIGPPSIFIGSPIYELGFANQAATDAYRTQLEAQIAMLQNDGLLIAYTNTNAYMNNAVDMSASNVTVPSGTGDNNAGTTCSAVTSGNVGQHPNICGHGHIADMFLGMIQPSPNPSASASSFPNCPTATLDPWCSVSIPASANAGNGGLSISVDAFGQGYTVPQQTTTAQLYPFMYCPGPANCAAGVGTHETSGVTDIVSLFITGPSGITHPIQALKGAPTGSIRVNADGSVTAPALKSITGTRFVCVDSAGNLTASATACSGT